MNVIKNLALVTLPEKELALLEHGALQYRRYSNIQFKVLQVNGKEMWIKVYQDRHLSENYISEEDLKDRAKELFGRFLPDYTIHAYAIPYAPHPINQITEEWILDQFSKKPMSVKDLVEATGIDNTNLSAWINGKRPMSQPVKAMFYYLIVARNAISHLKKEEREAIMKPGKFPNKFFKSPIK